MNCPFSSIVCLQAGLDRDAPPRTLQKMSQKSDSFAWNFCELYVIEKTQNAFGEFRAANVSSFARPLMTVGRPIQTHGPKSSLVSNIEDAAFALVAATVLVGVPVAVVLLGLR